MTVTNINPGAGQEEKKAPAAFAERTGAIWSDRCAYLIRREAETNDRAR